MPLAASFNASFIGFKREREELFLLERDFGDFNCDDAIILEC